MNISFEEQLATDMCGNEIQVGDRVVTTIRHYADLQIAVVVRFTPCKVVVKPLNGRYKGERMKNLTQVVKAVM